MTKRKFLQNYETLGLLVLKALFFDRACQHIADETLHEFDEENIAWIDFLLWTGFRRNIYLDAVYVDIVRAADRDVMVVYDPTDLIALDVYLLEKIEETDLVNYFGCNYSVNITALETIVTDYSLFYEKEFGSFCLDNDIAVQFYPAGYSETKKQFKSLVKKVADIVKLLVGKTGSGASQGCEWQEPCKVLKDTPGETGDRLWYLSIEKNGEHIHVDVYIESGERIGQHIIDIDEFDIAIDPAESVEYIIKQRGKPGQIITDYTQLSGCESFKGYLEMNGIDLQTTDDHEVVGQVIENIKEKAAVLEGQNA